VVNADVLMSCVFLNKFTVIIVYIK
jgi:hypothetical protein